MQKLTKKYFDKELKSGIYWIKDEDGYIFLAKYSDFCDEFFTFGNELGFDLKKGYEILRKVREYRG